MNTYSVVIYIPGEGHFSAIWKCSLNNLQDTVINFPIPENEVLEKNVLNLLSKDLKKDLSSLPENSFVIVSDMD